jgi:hypothetical protein
MTEGGPPPPAAGARLFARYAYSPNRLGYCGPAESAALFELAVTGATDADVTGIARRFSGAWPYAVLLAEMAGIAHPLDEAVMRAYWTGGDLLDRVDTAAYGRELIARLGVSAGQYWTHLTADLLPEVAPTHGFHVFGVYPWSRLLPGGRAEAALQVLDSCRISWGRVVAVHGDHATVRSPRLTWNGCRLGLSEPRERRVRLMVDGRGFVADAAPGDRLATHWDWVCDRLSRAQLAELEHRTLGQLAVTNARLARECAA